MAALRSSHILANYYQPLNGALCANATFVFVIIIKKQGYSLKKTILLLPLLSLSCFAAEDSKTKNYSVGLGMGAMYSGIGANISFVSKTDLKYVSAGCTEYSSSTGASCGFGTGWITTELFNFDSNNHGFGIYGGALGKEKIHSIENGEYSYNEENIYGVGLSYTYFINGIDKSGATLGISMHATNAESEGSYGGFLQIGYQF